MTNRLEDQVQHFVASMDHEEPNGLEQEEQETTGQEKKPIDTIHIHYFPDAIVILKEDEKAQVVDSTPVLPGKVSMVPAYAICFLYLLLIVSTLAFQLYSMFNPPIATITIVPKSQTVTLTGTLQVGRVLSILTISQSLTVTTTGKGHQDARSARGELTFYNGQFQSITIAAGTILTGASGIQIATDQDVTIPAGNPPSYGQASVSAHAITQGIKGNIPADDINQACCAASVLVKNSIEFTGGADERDFSTVSQQDINKLSAPLKTMVAQNMQSALQGQVNPNEQLQILPCIPTVTSDHAIGQEATAVKVTVSQTCSGVAYNRFELEQKATDVLTRQAVTKLGTGYNLLADATVRVTQANITRTTTPLVFLSFRAQGTWVYAVTQAEQQIKTAIAGKTKQQALRILQVLPGIKRVSIAWDSATMPKDQTYIHFAIFAM